MIEVRGQRSEGKKQKLEVGMFWHSAEGMEHRVEGRSMFWHSAEGMEHRVEGRSQKTEGRSQKSKFGIYQICTH
jgi:hypothetical protein